METLPATMNASRSLEGMLDGVAYPHVDPEAGVEARTCPLMLSAVPPPELAMRVATPEYFTAWLIVIDPGTTTGFALKLLLSVSETLWDGAQWAT